MGPRSKREYVEAVFLRYRKASRRGKTAILDEFCATLGCHRKHAIRVLKGFRRFTVPKQKKREHFVPMKGGHFIPARRGQ